ncbi:MAG TPA: PQQ-like beta-propeller repeat protein [Pirellulaceae bacterium]|nr:PQQ-like beta-propeller repeat protein [Pirellulaceae bacterium]
MISNAVVVRGIVISVLASVSPIVFGQEVAAPNPIYWNQWRGPQRTGLVDSEVLSSRDDLHGLIQSYRQELGESYSGPIVTRDRIYTTETHAKSEEIVRAVDRESGETAWQAQWPGALTVPFFARANGDWIRCTPIFDDGRLYVGGMRDVLVCLNASSGHELWRIDFVNQYGSRLPDFGFVSSPLIDGQALFVQAGAAVFKIDKFSGKVLWKGIENQGDMMTGGAFSSPIIDTLCGVRQLIVQTREELVGVDLENGSALWRQPVPHFRGMNILTPVVRGNQVFTSSYNHGSFLFEIERDEASGLWSVKTVWNNKVQGYMSSPVVIDGHIYLHLQNQRFTCLKWETGEERWRTSPFGKYWSMVAAGDRMLALDERGELLLIRANPEKFELLDRKKIADESTWAHLALYDDQVIIRELKALSVFRWQ